MKMIAVGRVVFCLFIFAVFGVNLVMAQDMRGVSVRERPRSEYDAMGIRAGAFIVKPRLSVGEEYNDNIYATKHYKESDWITVISPEIKAESNWSRHYLAIDGGGEFGVYASESDENYADVHLSAEGRLDVKRESFLIGRVAFAREHEERGAPDSSLAWEEPAVYYDYGGSLSYYYGLGKLSLSGGAEITSIDFESVDLLNGSENDLAYRDRLIYRLFGRVAYELRPQVQPFVEVRYNWRCYDEPDPAVGVERDSNGYRIGVGTGFDLGGITTGDIVFGYMSQNYDNLDDVDGFWYGFHLLWNVTQLTSVQIDVQRTIKETTYIGSSGIKGIDATLTIDHELLRNLLLGFSFSYTRDSYEGIDLVQTYYVLEPRITYLWNRYLDAEFSYRYETKDSDRSYSEYDINRVMISITAKF